MQVRHYDREMLGSLHQAQKQNQNQQQPQHQHQQQPGSPALAMPVTGASAAGAAGRETVTSPGGVEHSLKIAFLSQQQLKSFNLPYQLGFSNLPEAPDCFESPADADTASISGITLRPCAQYMGAVPLCRRLLVTNLFSPLISSFHLSPVFLQCCPGTS